MRPRIAFGLPLRFFELLPHFAFFATNIFQVALEKRQLRFLRIRLVTHRLTLPVLRAGLLCLAHFAKQIIFLFLKLAVSGLQDQCAVCGGLLLR